MLNGRLAITTPEGVRLWLTPAGPAVRAWAWAIDFLIWAAFAWAVVVALGWAGKLGQGLIGLLLFLSYWGYPIICEVYFGGRTIGKRSAGLEVLRADGLPVGWRESSLRNLLLVADFLPMCYASGLLCMLFDTQFRRIGDLAAGTIVVYRERPTPRPAALEAAPLALPFPLTPAQQSALADLFEREASLAPARLDELASLAEALTGCSGAASLERLRGLAAGLAK